MRNILLAAAAIFLAACTTPNDNTAMNGNAGGQDATDMTRDEEPPVPNVFRRPARTIDGWAAVGSGGMY